VQSPPRLQPGDAPEKAPVRPQALLRLASLRLRLISLAYEGLLLFAVLFVFSYLFLSLARDAQSGLPRAIFQVYLLSVCGVYFVFCWTRGGQTLPMKTWRMRIVTEDGRALSVGRAFRRYLLAIPGMLSGISLLWALFDRERQFLHDRLAGTRIVRENVNSNR
jgi:uncharacterized RDD family membrane protein YckC